MVLKPVSSVSKLFWKMLIPSRARAHNARARTRVGVDLLDLLDTLELFICIIHYQVYQLYQLYQVFKGYACVRVREEQI